MGSYHGKHSFDRLSHLRSCLIKSLNMEAVNKVRYPPHSAKKLSWARFFILKRVRLGTLGRLALLAAFVALAALVAQVTTAVHWGLKLNCLSFILKLNRNKRLKYTYIHVCVDLSVYTVVNMQSKVDLFYVQCLFHVHIHFKHKQLLDIHILM